MLLKTLLGEDVTLGRSICLPDGSNRREIFVDGTNTKVNVDSYSVLDAIEHGNLEKYVDGLVLKIRENNGDTD